MIDRSSNVALKYQVYDELKELFIREYKPEMILPTENSLAERYGVGLGTVRSALDKFRREGLIVRRSGRGTFLSKDFLVRLRTYKVGIILASKEFTDSEEWECSWFENMEMINGMMDRAQELNIRCRLIPEENISLSYVKDFDGYIIWGTLSDKLKKMIHGPCRMMRYDIDITQGFSAIGRDLAERRGGKIAFIGGPVQIETRLRPMEQVLIREGAAGVDRELTRICGGREEQAYEACLSLIEAGLPFDTLVCSTDLRALGALKALEERGVAVPREVKVYGFDGIRKTEICRPPLTTVEYDWNYPGDFAVRSIRAQLDGSSLPSYELPQGKLLKRRSTQQ